MMDFCWPLIFLWILYRQKSIFLETDSVEHLFNEKGAVEDER